MAIDQNTQLPSPEGYDNWQEWAAELIRALQENQETLLTVKQGSIELAQRKILTVTGAGAPSLSDIDGVEAKLTFT